jgi:hypothetical protein
VAYVDGLARNGYIHFKQAVDVVLPPEHVQEIWRIAASRWEINNMVGSDFLIHDSYSFG